MREPRAIPAHRLDIGAPRPGPVALLALVLALVPAAAPAKDAGGTPTAPATAPATPAPTGDAGAAAAPSGASGAATADSLFQSTLAQDISTASYYELVAWSRELGLDDAGSRSDLQARLAAHFDVTLPAPPEPGKRTITWSSRESTYYTVTEMDEKYVALRGGVVLDVRDSTDGSDQVVKADEITYNQSRKTVSAHGNVVYELTRGGKTDTFTGQSLAFNLDSSEAVFYDGNTTRTVTRGSNQVTYNFQGQTISRFSSDTVILDEGHFTSSATIDDPLYQVRASRVWLLAPGEWAMQNPLLMIGRVPVLYLPALFWPGDELFFNPNLGYKAREGSFVQTTTYLLGRKAKQDSPLSFLQISDSGDTGYSLEPHGLFLRKVPTSAPAKESTNSVKLMLDAYSRLGIMAGVAGDFTPLATFLTALAVSRSIFADSSGNSTPYFVNPDGSSASFWNTGSFFGLNVPFRYGLQGTFTASQDFYSVNAGFQYFSDPSFTSDFYTRSESGLLSNILAPPSTTTTTTAKQANLSWDFAGRLDFTRLVSLPFIQSLSLPNLNLKFTWQSYTPPGLTDPALSDPGSTFYYPSSLIAPNASLSFSGDLIRLSTNPQPTAAQAPARTGPPGAATSTAASASATGATSAGAPGPSTVPGSPPGASGVPTPSPGQQPAGQPSQPAPAAQPPATPPDPGKGFRAPLTKSQLAAASAPKPARIPFRAPVPLADIAGGAHAPESNFALSYSVQPRATLEHTFDTASSLTHGKADFDILYRTFETGGTTSLTATTSILDRLLDLSEAFTADGLWRSRLNPGTGLTAAALQSLVLSDLQQDRLTLRSSAQATVRPFITIAALAGTTVQYRLGLRLFQLSYTGTDPANPVFGTTGLKWTPDVVSEHTIVSTLALATPATNDSVAVTAQLSPLVPTLTGVVSLGAGILKVRLQGGASEPTTAPVYQPLIAGASIDLGNGITGSEELQYDIANTAVSRWTSQVGLGGFTGAFVVARMSPVDAQGNVTSITPAFLPSTLRLGYEIGSNPLWFWKDRIKVDLGVKTHWNLNLQKYVDNLFDFGLTLNFSIFQTLDLSFTSLSDNTRTYLYLPAWAAALSTPWVNPLEDLLASFNFFDPTGLDRVRSAFKIRTLQVTAVQHFHDWDLSFQYSGSPQLRADPADNNRLKYIWTPTFSVQVQWLAVPEVKSNIHGDSTGVFVR